MVSLADLPQIKLYLVCVGVLYHVLEDVGPFGAVPLERAILFQKLLLTGVVDESPTLHELGKGQAGRLIGLEVGRALEVQQSVASLKV